MLELAKKDKLNLTDAEKKRLAGLEKSDATKEATTKKRAELEAQKEALNK